MTVEDLYQLTRKAGCDPRKVEVRLRRHGDEIAEVEFEEDGQVCAYLIEEGAIHL